MRRLLESDPELIDLRRKAEMIKVQHAQLDQIAVANKSIKENKEINRHIDEDNIDRLKHESERSRIEAKKRETDLHAAREELLLQIIDKQTKKQTEHEMELSIDRANLERILESEKLHDNRILSECFASRAQIRAGHQQFMDQRRLLHEKERQSEADRIAADKAYIARVSEREAEVAKLKRMHEIKRNRIASAISSQVAKTNNNREREENLINQLHMEEARVRDEDIKCSKEMKAMNDRAALLEEYRFHMECKDRKLAETRNAKMHERDEQLRAQNESAAEVSRMRNEKLSNQRILHRELDSLLHSHRNEFLEARNNFAKDGCLVRELDNREKEIIQSEKTKILGDLKQLTMQI